MGSRGSNWGGREASLTSRTSDIPRREVTPVSLGSPFLSKNNRSPLRVLPNAAEGALPTGSNPPESGPQSASPASCEQPIPHTQNRANSKVRLRNTAVAPVLPTSIIFAAPRHRGVLLRLEALYKGGSVSNLHIRAINRPDVRRRATKLTIGNFRTAASCAIIRSFHCWANYPDSEVS